MNPRRLLILGIAAVVALAVAVLLANRTNESTPATDALLYPDLKAQADSVTAIRIFKAGDARAIEVKRNGAEWTLSERNGYPIAAAKARNLVRALSNAKVLEEKTSDASKYSSLSVEDVSDAGAKGVRIELEGPATPVNLIVGKDAPGGKSSYVRRVGEPKSWLVSEQLSASPEPRDWLDKDIMNVSADRIQSAEISIEGQKPYTASKSSRADAAFKVEPLPKGKQLSSANAADDVATGLLSLSLDDVQPKADIASGKTNAQATYKTFDGLVVELAGFKKDDKHYVTIKTSYDAALADKFKVKTADDAKAADNTKPNAADGAAKAADDANAKAADASKGEGPAPAATPPAPDVAAEAEKTNAKVGNWAYEISSYKYDSIFRPLDGMLKK